MTVSLKSKLLGLVFSLALLPLAGARAEYPERVITGVVPFAAGGNSDVLARVVAEGMAKELGRPVVIENKPGAGGNIGIDAVAHAKPDGYTVLFSSIATTQNPAVYRKLPYDPLKDIVPVALFGAAPLVVVVNAAKIPSTTLKDFADLVRKNPRKFNLAAGGGGKRMSIEWFFVQAGIPSDSVELINYRSSQDATVSTMNGETEFTLGDVVTTKPALESGKVRVLAVAADTRSPVFPTIPTAKEAGYPNYVDYAHVGLYITGGAPADVIAKLNATVNKVLATPDVIARFVNLGYTVTPSTQQQFDTLYRTEIAQWKEMAAKAKLEPIDE